MMRSYRSILHTVTLKVYEEYLQNGECIDRRRIDLERYRLRKIICKVTPTNRDPYRRLEYDTYWVDEIQECFTILKWLFLKSLYHVNACPCKTNVERAIGLENIIHMEKISGGVRQGIHHTGQSYKKILV